MLLRVLVVALILLCLVAPPAVCGASPQKLRWEELSAIVGKTVSIAMPGAVISGKATAVESDALLVQVNKTTDAKVCPKGPTRVPRATLRTLEVRTKGTKYRIVGTVAGALVGLAGGLGAAIGIDGLFGENHNGGKAAAAFIGITGAATAGGYFLGNAADRKTSTIEIVP